MPEAAGEEYKFIPHRPVIDLDALSGPVREVFRAVGDEDPPIFHVVSADGWILSSGRDRAEAWRNWMTEFAGLRAARGGS